jgi:hypothetical protein
MRSRERIVIRVSREMTFIGGNRGLVAFSFRDFSCGEGCGDCPQVDLAEERGDGICARQIEGPSGQRRVVGEELKEEERPRGGGRRSL